ncbi:hypothetical protein N0V93_007695 [Gnomoniopsis smithogilvyi]|uniref:Uncharacterized protein n=1 Tax=Gnomoniopsis smithogilvyi TaxID=1191159 RepID=A0A9W9CU17_9PEZI|nr:hypothetical protein N0V93_007695 [Gnomoniopsis smithogilvyi]
MDVAQMPSGQASHEPILMGIYGISGSGVELLKNRLLFLLRQRGNDDFQCFDLRYHVDDMGQAIGQHPTNLPRSEDELDNLRKSEIAEIRERCSQSGKVGLILSHRRLIRSDLDNPDGEPLIRSARWGVDASFSYVFYYSASPAIVVRTLLDDPSYYKIPRKRLTQKLIRAWDSKEGTSLMAFCNSHRVPMSVCEAEQPGLPERLVSTIVRNCHSNQHRVVAEVVRAMNIDIAPSKAVVLIEAHNVLAWDIASTKLWTKVSSTLASLGASSGAAFRRDLFMILRQEASRHGDRAQAQTPQGIMLDPELERLLWKLTHMRIPTVVLTCGIKSTWAEVFGRLTIQERHGIRCPWEKPSTEPYPGFDGKVKVIGGGRTSDDLVIAPPDKAAVVRALREKHGRRVYVIGGTELDVPMLKAAGQDAFIRPPYVGEMHDSVKALLREHGGQATYLGPRVEAFSSDWQGVGRDIFDLMGLSKEESKGDDDEILNDPETEIEYLLDQAEFSLGTP